MELNSELPETMLLRAIASSIKERCGESLASLILKNKNRILNIYGIKLKELESAYGAAFLSPHLLRTNLLDTTCWAKEPLASILKRCPGSKRERLRVYGTNRRGITIPIEQLMNQRNLETNLVNTKQEKKMNFEPKNRLMMDFEVEEDPEHPHKKILTVVTKTGAMTTGSLYGESAGAIASCMLSAVKELSPITYKEMIWDWFNRPLNERVKLINEINEHHALMDEG